MTNSNNVPVGGAVTECDLCRAERLLAEDPDYHPFLWPRDHSTGCPRNAIAREAEK